MRLFSWLLLLDWLVVSVWLWRVVVWRLHLHRVPDLLAPPYAEGPPSPSGPLPSLSVIVPARNEEGAIAETLRSLQRSEGVALQIIAVNDRSTDRTGSLMDAAAGGGAPPAGTALPVVTLEVVHIATLPPGWLGKTHAMATAARQARGEWLLFTDGDILFRQDALWRALRFAVASGGDHVVVMPTVLLQTAGERMMIGFLHVLSLFAVRPWLVPDPTAKRDAIGIGAFNLVRRDVYERLGGWEAFRMEVVEDVAFGRRVKAMGLAQRVATGRDLVSVRWAVGALGVVGNMTKNLFALAGFRPAVLLGGAAGLAVFTLLPIAMCAVGSAGLPPLGVLLAALFLAYSQAGRHHRSSPARRRPRWGALPLLTFPIASCLMVYALLRSMALAWWWGGVYWRDTFYPLAELRARASGPR